MLCVTKVSFAIKRLKHSETMRYNLRDINHRNAIQSV